jgi:hypothetical protein
MKKLMIAASVLLPLGVAPAMADPSWGHHGGRSMSERSSDLIALGAFAHFPAASDADMRKCAAYLAGRDGVHPFECVGTRSNLSEGSIADGPDTGQ